MKRGVRETGESTKERAGATAEAMPGIASGRHQKGGSVAPQVDFSAPRTHEHVSEKPSPLEDFHWEYTEEPHATRRKQILARHPEVKALFGPCPATKYVTAALVALQLALAVHLRDQPVFSWKYLAVLYFVGGTANHALMLANHEISHNLAFKSIALNRLLAMFANLPIGLPYSVAFKGYHAEHHKFQGVDDVDTDIPTEVEAKYSSTAAENTASVELLRTPKNRLRSSGYEPNRDFVPPIVVARVAEPR
ncbi:MAG: sphingolipid Delta4-desaturase-domain-containing protein [Olpidium bornovanus]|uniref:Sphingolipid Delta4-desaturase-domain-containing protein n=1 Tax=Olpidium bornovanus TaxID=278681 RepID=A0A8H8DK27_9FUNG|nr:MAG: sphingolipid Delta4-desaturase-domain-containing protein [Olpidium bornovanus]